MSIWTHIAETISASRNDLIKQGYSREDMDNLFGEDGIHFPKSADELSKAVHIVGLLIKNNQYKPEDKERLVKMANAAYKTYRVMGRVKPVVQNEVDETKAVVETSVETDVKRKGWKEMNQGAKIAIIGGSALLVGLIIVLAVRNK